MKDQLIERLDALMLDSLRYHAKLLQANIHSVEHYARAVVFKRPFETMAEDELKRAETMLESALQVVRKAQSDYQSKRPMFAEAAE